MGLKRGLHRVQLLGRADALDGLDRGAVSLGREDQAGPHGFAVEEHRTAAAGPGTAAHMRTGQTKLVTQEFAEQHARCHGRFDLMPVHDGPDDARMVLGRTHARAPVCAAA